MKSASTLNAVVKPCRRLAGAVAVPGDKSISHRVAILAALCKGRSRARGFLRGDDCMRTLQAMREMGAGFRFGGEVLEIEGAGGELRPPRQPLDLGNSGTSMRLLAGIAAGMPWSVEMTGDESLRSRPMRRIKEPLELMGARVELLGAGGKAPIRVAGGRLKAVEYRMPVASAQVKSCVLLAGLFAEGETAVYEPCPTRDHTELALKALGAAVACGEDGRVSVRGYGPQGPAWPARDWTVPGDFSSAAFWLVAGAGRISEGVRLENTGLNPRRTALLEVLRAMGAALEVRPEPRSEGHEPGGTITIRPARLRAAEVGGAVIANIIDELPLVAVAGALAEGRTVIRDAAELRVKESDRIAVMARNMSAAGVRVEERPDGLIVFGCGRVPGGCAADSAGDHRMAMAMAVLALYAEAPILIRNVGCVDTSYPEFWEHLRRLGGEVELDSGN